MAEITKFVTSVIPAYRQAGVFGLLSTKTKGERNDIHLVQLTHSRAFQHGMMISPMGLILRILILLPVPLLCILRKDQDV